MATICNHLVACQDATRNAGRKKEAAKQELKRGKIHPRSLGPAV
jgi:hypothetical protein